jgi:hypothetical protein
MDWSEFPWKPAPSTLRQFALLWLASFMTAGSWHWFVHAQAQMAAALIVIAVVGGGAGLLKPALVQPLFVGWMLVAFPIGVIISTVVLGLLYYGLFTPIGIVFRLWGRDALWLRKQATATSYWQPKAMAQDPRRYFQQF